MISSLIICAKGFMILLLANFGWRQLVTREDADWFGRKPLWMMLGLYAVGVLGHFPWLAYAAMTAVLPILARSRGEGAALFVIAIGSMPDCATNVRVGGAAIATMDKWFFFSLGLLIVFLRHRRAGLTPGRWFDLPFLLLLAVELVQARDLNFTSAVRVILTTLTTMALPYFCFTRCISKLEDLRRVMLSIAFIGFVLSVCAVFEARTQFLLYQYIQSALGTINMGALIYKFRGGLLRAVTSFGDATSFSLFLSVAMTALIASRYSFRTTGRMVIAIAVIAAGIAMTSSRNAIIAVVIAILCFDLYRRRYTALFGKAALLGMGYAVMSLASQFSRYAGTMMGQSSDTASTSEYRSLLLQRGLEEFRKHPYLGLNQVEVIQNMIDLKQGEGIVDFVNGYLFYALTCGIGGVIALVLAFLLPAMTMVQARRRLVRSGILVERYAAFVFAVGITYFITTSFTGFGNRGSMYYYLSVGIGSLLYSWRAIDPQLIIASGKSDPRKRRLLPLAPRPAEPVPA